MALLAFLIGMSVLSCQSNDDDNYNSPKEQNLTAVDLLSLRKLIRIWKRKSERI